MDDKLLGLSNYPEYLYKGSGFTHKLSTGIVTLDLALGGGFPLNGAVTEIYGEESHGKSTLAYRICKVCTQTPGGYITWVDSENSYDDSWAKVQGLNTERAIVYRPPYMEAANEIILSDIAKYKSEYLPWLVNNKWKPTKEQAEAADLSISDVEGIKKYMEEVAPPHIIVWDSLAASPVRSVAEAEGDFKEGMAYRARLIKSFLSRYQVNVIGCEKVSMVLINQVIDNIGDMFGPAFSTPGGRGLKHAKSLAIYVKKSGSGEKDADNFKINDYVMLAITKNKVTPVIASFPVIFSKSQGFIGATSVLEYLWNVKWFKDAGSWKKFNYYEIDKSTGEIKDEEEISIQRGSFYETMKKRPELFEFLCEQVKCSFVEKFPFNESLKSTNTKEILSRCDLEFPDDEEVETIE